MRVVGTDVESVEQSLGRAVLSGDLFQTFYDIFMESHADIRPRFVDTDFDKQKQLLRQGVNLAIMAAKGSATGLRGTERIAKSHNREGLDIQPRLYGYWLASFLEAISRHDKEFSPELEESWREVLQETIDRITAAY